MRAKRTFAVLLGISAIASSVWAEKSPTPITSRNIVFHASIDAYEDTYSKKVSGTNQVFGVKVECTSNLYEPSDPHWDTAWISYVKIKMDNETVAEYSCTSEQDRHMIRDYTVKWDTTHFAPNQQKVITVEAKCHVKDEQSEPELVAEAATVSVTTYNRGRACETPFATQDHPTAQAVATFFGPVNHDGGYVQNVTKTPCLNYVKDGTVFYFCGSGASSSFGDDENSWLIATRELQSNRQQAAEQGLPPTNFVHLDASDTGMTNSIANAFLYPTTSVVDRAVLAWKIDVENEWPNLFSGLLWNEIGDGYTISAALANIWAAFYAVTISDDEIPDAPSTWTTALAIYGDSATKVHGLYGGPQGDLTNWFSVTCTTP